MSDWDEAAHPRDGMGKFSGGGGDAPGADKAALLRRWSEKITHARKHAVKKQEKREKMRKTVTKLKDTLPVLKTSFTLGEHVRKAKGVLNEHKKDFDEAVTMLKEAATPGTKIKGRVKELESVLGKMVRKPSRYQQAEDLQDATGLRMVGAVDGPKALDNVKKIVEGVRGKFKVVEHDDYLDTPNTKGDILTGYRSYHVIIEHNGKAKEIQIRTPRQETHAVWAHNAYKPLTKEQEKALKDHKETVAKYARDVSEHFYDRDTGGKRATSMPPCPPIVQEHFGCVHHKERTS